MEWRLFPEGTIPGFTTSDFFERHPWVPPETQEGHFQRTQMVADLIQELPDQPASITDLGCGDGSLLAELAGRTAAKLWGYDAGRANVARAQSLGLDVRLANLRTDHLEFGDLLVACEVIEHLTDPHEFVADLPGNRIVLSSPSAETDEWHYVHHAWAWDMDGYRAMIEAAGWTVVEHRDCSAPAVLHCDQWRPQRFQVIAAVR